MLTKTEMMIYEELIIKRENNLLDGWDCQMMVQCDVKATPRQHALAYSALGYDYAHFRQTYPFLDPLCKYENLFPQPLNM